MFINRVPGSSINKFSSNINHNFVRSTFLFLYPINSHHPVAISVILYMFSVIYQTIYSSKICRLYANSNQTDHRTYTIYTYFTDAVYGLVYHTKRTNCNRMVRVTRICFFTIYFILFLIPLLTGNIEDYKFELSKPV